MSPAHFRRLLPALVAAALLLAGAPAASAAPGNLDAGFGAAGIATASVGSDSDCGFWLGCTDLALQPDGKIVVVGTSHDEESSEKDFAVVRFASDGMPDTSFSDDGVQLIDFGGSVEFGSAVALQPDGKIVVVGSAIAPSGFLIGRLNPDGSLDTTFSGDGRQTATFGSGGSVASAYDVAVQADGKIVVVGGGGAFSDSGYFAVARFNADGSFDSTFSGDGRTTTDFGGEQMAASVVLDGDRIVVGGIRREPSFVSGQFALARYDSNGSLDSSFSGDGKQTTDVVGDGVQDLALQSDGKILAVGDEVRDTGDFALVRYTEAGELDPTFSSDGVQTTNLGGQDVASGVAVQSDGKIVVVGSTFSALDDGAVVRYLASGELDSGFSEAGAAQPLDFGGQGQVNAISLQPDGKILAAGLWDAGLGSRLAVARLVGGASILDTTPPETTITSGPSGVITTATPGFAFASSEPSSTFECRLDTGPFAPCMSPYTLPSTSEGAHTFEVRAIDGAGNVDPTPASTGFTVDLPDVAPPDPPGGGGDDTDTPGGSLVAPAISGVQLSRRVIRTSGPPRLRRTALRFQLSRASKLTLSIARIKGGVKKAGRCVRPKPGSKGKACDLPIAKLVRSLEAGEAKIALGTRVGGKRLSPGKYRLSVRAEAGGLASQVATVVLRVRE